MIHPKYIGSKFWVPVQFGCILWLMLDRLDANGLAHGIAWTLFACLLLIRNVVPTQEEWVHPRQIG